MYYMQKVGKYISLLLIIIIVFTVMPKDLIHEFFHHSENETCPGSILADSHEGIYEGHTHCALFDLKYQPALKKFLSIINVSCATLIVCNEKIESFHFVFYNSYFFYRGPPTIIG